MKSIKNILPELKRFPSLVVGPSATTHSGIFNEIVGHICSEYSITLEGDDEVTNYLDIISHLREEDLVLESRIRESIKKMLLSFLPAAPVRSLAGVNWSAIVSLSPDMCLEDALSEKLDKVASSRTITIIDSATVLPHFRTTPMYKLLGNPRNRYEEATAVTTQSELMLKQNIWTDILATFADYTKNSPVLIIGNDTSQQYLERFFAALMSLPPPRPNLFLCMKNDGVSNNRIIAELLRGKARLVEIDCTIKEFCNAVIDTVQQPKQLSLLIPEKLMAEKKEIHSELSDFDSFISIVPSELPTDYDMTSHFHQLVDGLFRPTCIDWDPYLADLHLKRTTSIEMAEAIKSRLSVSEITRLSCFLLKGEASTGKSCVMKEVATILSADGCLVVWIKRLPVDSAQYALKELAKKISVMSRKSREGGQLRVVVMCDEPWSSRITPYELTNEFNTSGAAISLVFSCRHTDFLSEAGVTVNLPVMPDEEFELPIMLDDDELNRLPSVLVNLKIFENIDIAELQVKNTTSKNSADVLCHLWFLIPDTRAAITMSLEDEYLSMSNIDHHLECVVNDIGKTSANARLAYGCAAVCSDFQIGLPTEVLVRALRIDFNEWVEMCNDGKPLWGLLYPEENNETGEVLYRTRNSVVTTVLLRVLNGGLGHAGEIEILKKLILACEIGTDVYRSFLIDLLVRCRKKLGTRYNLEQGIELFELVRDTLPHPDRTIEHQYGLWLKDKGADLDKAHKQLQNALATPDNPAASSSERQEHIHTSLASTVVSQARDGSKSIESAFSEVQEHLRYAQSPTFFNPHTTHVFGTLLLDLSLMHAGPDDTMTQLKAVAEAIPAIERTFQIIGASGQKDRRFDKSIMMLSTLQQKLLDSISDLEEIKEIAIEIYNKNTDQIGFSVVMRKLLLNATGTSKGRDFLLVKEYFDECSALLESKNDAPNERMISSRIDLYIRWQIHGGGTNVDWEIIHSDLEYVCTSPIYKDDIIKLFYYGVALFHVQKISEANVIFSKLRSLAHLPKLKGNSRVFLLGNGGMPKRLQGKLRKSHDRWYVEIPDIGTDLILRDAESNLVNGRDIHCYIGFSFFGPFATQKRPELNDMTLPF